MDNEYIIIHNIPFKFLTFRYNAANLRIGESKQKVFIPKKFFNSNGTLKENVNLDWWFYKPINQYKIKLYKLDLESKGE